MERDAAPAGGARNLTPGRLRRGGVARILVCAGATALSRSGGFPGPVDGLDAGGLSDARACRVPARFAGRVLCSPARRCEQTARLLGRRSGLGVDRLRLEGSVPPSIGRGERRMGRRRLDARGGGDDRRSPRSALLAVRI